MSTTPESYVGTWPMRGRIFIPLFDQNDELNQHPVRWSELATLAGWPGGIDATTSLTHLLDDIQACEGDAYADLRLPSTLRFMRDSLVAWNADLITAATTIENDNPDVAHLCSWHPDFDGLDLWLADVNRPVLRGAGFAIGGVPFGDSLFVGMVENLWEFFVTSDLEFAYCPPDTGIEIEETW